MVIKLNTQKDEYKTAKENYVEVLKNDASTPTEIETAWVNMQDKLVDSLTRQIKEEVIQNGDASGLINKNLLTGEERKFFNSITTDVGTKDETLLPEKTVVRVFEDLTTDHPLLTALNVQTTGLKTKIITSDTTGTAAWGPIFGDIKGQLDAMFSTEDVTQGKATAFVVLPKDLVEYGPEWIELFVRTQIVETFSVALEQGFLLGAGPLLHEPIGLIKELTQTVSPTTGYANKEPLGTLTLTNPTTAIQELGAVYKHLAVKENGKYMKVNGKVNVVVNPLDAIDLETNFTVLNANGEFVQAVPRNLKIIESIFMNPGQLLFFVEGRYDAAVGGSLSMKVYNQTLALEDCDLYIAKQYAFGKPRDNKAAALYTLA